MKKSHLKYLTVITLTLLCSLIVHRVETAQPIRNDKFFSFPLTIGEWKGKEIAMSEYVYQGIETPYLFLRNYYSPMHNSPVNLSIVWFDDRNIAFHAPEACMGGVGNQVVEKSRKKVTLQGSKHEIEALVVQMPGQHKQLVWYFFDVDGYITASQTDIRLRVLKKRLLGKRASASFIRLMAPLIEDRGAVEQTLALFLEALMPLVPNYTHTDIVRT